MSYASPRPIMWKWNHSSALLSPEISLSTQPVVKASVCATEVGKQFFDMNRFFLWILLHFFHSPNTLKGLGEYCNRTLCCIIQPNATSNCFTAPPATITKHNYLQLDTRWTDDPWKNNLVRNFVCYKILMHLMQKSLSSWAKPFCGKEKLVIYLKLL